ncbi:MAG: TIGR02391 family protein [Mycobacterium kyogaense]|uniref:TIGR02391 family protein n=1 Tax=Mycobacterium kyogaense TaxID=2212479 RepID=UPI002FFD42B4
MQMVLSQVCCELSLAYDLTGMTNVMNGPRGPVPPEQLRELPTEAIGLILLQQMAISPEQVNTYNIMVGADSGYRGEKDAQHLVGRLSDALAWIESRGLIGPTGSSGNWRRLTALGRELAADSDGHMKRLLAADRLAGKLDQGLEAKVRLTFASGDYETAAFAAMKEVEVAVRAAGRFDNSKIGVSLMRQAFAPEEGPLSDSTAERGERVATMDLFAGAIGAFKNPSSHRTVNFEDPIEAAEIIQLADLLLKIVRRAEARKKPKRKPRAK